MLSSTSLLYLIILSVYLFSLDSYWSVRAGNRPFNRGLRLDYFIASSSLCLNPGGNLTDLAQAKGKPCVIDAYILDQDTNGISDHAPVGLDLMI